MQKIMVGLPKGRLWESTNQLFSKSGITIRRKERDYRPKTNLYGFEFFSLKPRNIPKMVETGALDAGIVGIDMVKDEEAEVDSLIDLRLMPVYIILAGKDKKGLHPRKKTVRVASEYTNISMEYLKSRIKNFEIIKTYGSTECFVPEFADLIIDHTQTGTTLKLNKLRVFDLIMKSTTHLIANKKVPKEKRERLLWLKGCLQEGLKGMDLSYPEFLREEQVRQGKI